jgi:hypothetical protein
MLRNRRTRLWPCSSRRMLQLIIFGYAVNLDVDNLRMGWMDMKTTRPPAATICLANFQGSGRFLHHGFA